MQNSPPASMPILIILFHTSSSFLELFIPSFTLHKKGTDTSRFSYKWESSQSLFILLFFSPFYAVPFLCRKHSSRSWKPFFSLVLMTERKNIEEKVEEEFVTFFNNKFYHPNTYSTRRKYSTHTYNLFCLHTFVPTSSFSSVSFA